MLHCEFPYEVIDCPVRDKIYQQGCLPIVSTEIYRQIKTSIHLSQAQLPNYDLRKSPNKIWGTMKGPLWPQGPYLRAKMYLNRYNERILGGRSQTFDSAHIERRLRNAVRRGFSPHKVGRRAVQGAHRFQDGGEQTAREGKPSLYTLTSPPKHSDQVTVCV